MALPRWAPAASFERVGIRRPHRKEETGETARHRPLSLVDHPLDISCTVQIA